MQECIQLNLGYGFMEIHTANSEQSRWHNLWQTQSCTLEFRMKLGHCSACWLTSCPLSPELKPPIVTCCFCLLKWQKTLEWGISLSAFKDNHRHLQAQMTHPNYWNTRCKTAQSTILLMMPIRKATKWQLNGWQNWSIKSLDISQFNSFLSLFCLS